jgi:hypothetical protein
MTMGNLARRLSHLETRLAPPEDRLAWVDVQAAMTRQQARARVRLCQRLGVDASDPRVAEAIARLAGDDEARSAQDAELIARWRRVHGLRADAGEVRRRLAQRLEAMARRQRDDA